MKIHHTHVGNRDTQTTTRPVQTNRTPGRRHDEETMTVFTVKVKVESRLFLNVKVCRVLDVERKLFVSECGQNQIMKSGCSCRMRAAFTDSGHQIRRNQFLKFKLKS